MELVRDTSKLSTSRSVVKQCKTGSGATARLQPASSRAHRFSLAQHVQYDFGFDEEQCSDKLLCFREPGDDTKDEFPPLVSTLNVNSLLLSGWSPYFKSLFLGGFRERSEREVDIDVGEGQTEACMDVIRFIYDNGNKDFQNAKTVAELMNIILIADRFQVESACVLAVDQLIDSKPLTFDLCEAVLALPETITRAKWFKETSGRIQKALLEYHPDLDILLDTQEFLTFSASALALILSSDELQLKCENSVFVAAYRWFLSDKRTPEELSDDSPNSPVNQLLNSFRFSQMTSGFFLDVVRHFQWKREGAAEFSCQKQITENLVLRAMKPTRSNAVIAARSAEKQFRKRASMKPVELKAVFTKEEIVSLEEGYRIQGQHTNVYGYAMSLAAAPESREGETYVRSVLLLNDEQSFTSKDSWMEAECELEVQGFGIDYQRERKHSFGSLAMDHKDLALGWYSLHAVNWDKVHPSDTLSICLRVKILC